MEQQQPPTTEPSPEAEISIAGVESLLMAEDPEFGASMRELGEIKVEADLSEETLDVDDAHPNTSDLATDDVDKGSESPSLFMKLAQGLMRAVRGVWRWFIYTWEEYRQLGWAHAKKQARSGVHLAKNGALWLFKTSKQGLIFVRSLNWRERLVLLFALTLFAVVGMAVRFAFSNRQVQLIPDRYLTDLRKVADRTIEFETESDFIDFFVASDQPQFFVSLDKLVVNLKASEGSTRLPMGAFQFYVEADTQDGAIEIKDRQKEMRDKIQRSLEEMSYAQIASPEGKQQVKIMLREKLNEIMTKGSVKRVLIDHVILKP